LTPSVSSVHCDAVLFDMDGTLVDSTIVVERQWRRWAARHELDPEPILAVAHGRRTLDTFLDVAPHLATEEEAARFEAEEAEDREGVVAVPGAALILAGLPPDRWAVVTSANRGLAEDRLRSVGLPVPAVLVSADDVSRGKPDPEGYLTAARLLAVRPERCLVVEDTPAGAEAGRAAQMSVIAVTTTYPAEALRASVCVPDLRWLSPWVADGAIEVRVRRPRERG